MAGQSIWDQMNSMPFSWQAWQAISQISYLMFDQDLLTRYYAYNAYFYFYYDTELLESGVFGMNSSLAPSVQTAIYEDESVGMNSQFKLCYWVRAADPNNMYRESNAKYLQSYFQDKDIPITITNEQMEQIVGPNSTLRMIVNMLQETIRTAVCENECEEGVDRYTFAKV